MKRRLLAFSLALCMALSVVPAFAQENASAQNRITIADEQTAAQPEVPEQPASIPIVTLSKNAGAYVGKAMTMKAAVSGLTNAMTGVTVAWSVNGKTVQTTANQTIKNGTALSMKYTLPTTTKKTSNTVKVTLKQGTKVLASASTTVPTLFGFTGAKLTASGATDITVKKSTSVSMKLTGLKASLKGTYQWYVDGKAVAKAKGSKTFKNNQTLKYTYKPTKTGTHKVKLVIKSADGKVSLTSSVKKVTAHQQYAKTLGSYTTYFATSNRNRCTNMRLVVKAINGKVIQPGKAFSLNSATGKRNASRGYKLSIVFHGTRQAYGYGGGSCQVASTLFNAALLANMTIKERHNHTLPVTYIAKGRDAAIGSSADFRFKNNLSVPVKIVATYNSRGSITIKLKANYEAANKKPTLKVTRTSGYYRYVLRRYVNGKVNYTTRSRN